MSDQTKADHSELQRALDTYCETDSYRQTGRILQLSKDTIRRRVKKARALGLLPNVTASPGRRSPQIEDEIAGNSRIITSKGNRIVNVEQLLNQAEVNLAEWIITKKILNKWDGLGRGEDGTTEVIPLYQIKLWLERRPSFFLQSVEPVQAIRRSLPKIKAETETALILPDAQIGFRKRKNELVPFHDRTAMDLALQAAQLIQPDKVVILGDWLDFPELSRFTTEPETRFLIQPALIECAWYLQALMLVLPSHCTVHWTEGNHEMRLRNSLLEHHSGALADVRSVDNLDGPPAMSVENLLGLDKLGIEYIAPYGTPFWLWDVMIHHGHVVRGGGGKTASSIVSSASHSQIVGHIHRRELCSRTLIDPTQPNGQRVISVMSPGALCSTMPGIVPAGRGRPNQDWQQGLGLVHRTADDLTHLSLIPIDNGSAVINGRFLQGNENKYIGELKRATGVDF